MNLPKIPRTYAIKPRKLGHKVKILLRIIGLVIIMIIFMWGIVVFGKRDDATVAFVILGAFIETICTAAILGSLCDFSDWRWDE